MILVILLEIVMSEIRRDRPVEQNRLALYGTLVGYSLDAFGGESLRVLWPFAEIWSPKKRKIWE